MNVRAETDFYDDVHYRRASNAGSTLCGLKVRGAPLQLEVSCPRCRQFAAGDF